MDNKLDAAREQINKIDAEMARLFAERMHAVEAVAGYKAENGLQIRDENRENQLVSRNLGYIADENKDILDAYAEFQRKVMDLSVKYQEKLIKK